MFTHPNIILPQTLHLLHQLMRDEHCKQFFLVGGTALALKIGHRLSIDLDLFTADNFDVAELQYHLENTYGFETDYLSKNTIKGVVNGIKVDFIAHQYKLVEGIDANEQIRMASIQDIAAMKLSAITQNGTRYKDFVDLYFLLEKMSFSQMLQAFELKYPKSNAIMAIKGLTYFDDINFEVDRPVLIQPIHFEVVKDRLEKAILQPYKIF